MAKTSFGTTTNPISQNGEITHFSRFSNNKLKDFQGFQGPLPRFQGFQDFQCSADSLYWENLDKDTIFRLPKRTFSRISFK